MRTLQNEALAIESAVQEESVHISITRSRDLRGPAPRSVKVEVRSLTDRDDG